MRHRAFIVALGSAAVWALTACAPAAMGPVTYFADPDSTNISPADFWPNAVSFGASANRN